MRFIEDLRGIHQGEEIWVIGSGPSLDDFPGDFFDDRVSIALNDAYLAFPNCTYIHSCDIAFMEYMGSTRPKLLGKCIFTERPGRVDWGSHQGVILMQFNGAKGTKQDIEQVAKCIMEKGKCRYITVSTTAHTAIETAAVLGAKKITLAGCEARAMGNKHFAKRGGLDKRHKEQPQLYVDYRDGVRWLAEVLEPTGIEVSRYYYKDILEYGVKAGYERVDIEEAVEKPARKAQKKGIDHDATEVDGMKIRCTNPGTKMMYVPKIEDRRVVFSKNGYATVSDKLGHYLVRTCSAIEEIKPEKKARAKAKGRGKTTLKEGE